MHKSYTVHSTKIENSRLVTYLFLLGPPQGLPAELPEGPRSDRGGGGTPLSRS